MIKKGLREVGGVNCPQTEKFQESRLCFKCGCYENLIHNNQKSRIADFIFCNHPKAGKVEL